jgi:hypothetical protein
MCLLSYGDCAENADFCDSRGSTSGNKLRMTLGLPVYVEIIIIVFFFIVHQRNATSIERSLNRPCPKQSLNRPFALRPTHDTPTPITQALTHTPITSRGRRRRRAMMKEKREMTKRNPANTSSLKIIAVPS